LSKRISSFVKKAASAAAVTVLGIYRHFMGIQWAFYGHSMGISGAFWGQFMGI
jgi:hypothetical protein